MPDRTTRLHSYRMAGQSYLEQRTGYRQQHRDTGQRGFFDRAERYYVQIDPGRGTALLHRGPVQSVGRRFTSRGTGDPGQRSEFAASGPSEWGGRFLQLLA